MNRAKEIDGRIKNLESQIENARSCDCDVTKPRVRVAKNGMSMYAYQCVRCGKQSSWIPHHKIKNKTAIVPIDDDLPQRFLETSQDLVDALSEVKQELYDAEIGSKKETFSLAYNEYLQTPKWREKREGVLERAKRFCEG